ncbi:MAG: hypothetical protein J7K04_15850 [Spirochaetales bacterium]|nr:hypothetical protein [Spirochaetales bacterium]
MTDKTKLEELSSELPEKERKELLDKITKRMKKEEKEEIIHVELKEDERDKIIAYEMDQLTFLQRVILWFKKFFSGKTPKESFLDLKLAGLKKRIHQISPGLTGFETRNLTPKFAKRLYDVYKNVYPLLPFFRVFSKNSEFRHNATAFLVEKKYDGVKKSIGEFITIEEMEEIFATTGFEDEIKKEVLKRLNKYLKSIPESLFNEIEAGIKTFSYLEKIIFFPYGTVFQYFHYNLNETPEDKYPFFENAPIMLLLDLLEKLYYAVYLVNRLPDEYVIHEAILLAYIFFKRDEDLNTEVIESDAAKEIEELKKEIKEIIDNTRDFYKKIPLLEIIRYFRKDPYYRLMFNIPKIYTKALYATFLKEKLLAGFKARLKEIKIRVIDKRILEIFKERKIMDLFYYNENPHFDYRKLGLPYFHHIKSLTLLYNYLNYLYKNYIQDAIQLVNNYLLSNNRIVQNRVMQYASGLEDLEAKIVLFDRSLSNDEEDGKVFMQFRYNLVNDITLQKSYRAFVYQKDKEAMDMLAKGKEYMLGLKKIFDEILTSPMESIKSTLKTLHFTKGKSYTLNQILKSRSDNISKFINILSQLLEIEKGD